VQKDAVRKCHLRSGGVSLVMSAGANAVVEHCLGRGSATASCWDCGFESRRGHGCLSLVNVEYCQVEVSVTGRSLVQRSHTECVCVSLSVIMCNINLLQSARVG